MTEVVPAIIPKSFEDLKEKILKVQSHVKTVQIDIMDGHFSPEPSWPFDCDCGGLVPELSINLSQETRVGFELDMMVLNPERYIDSWSDFGVNTFIIHYGSTDKIEEIIDTLKKKGRGVGIAIKPAEGIEVIKPFLDKIEMLQIMGNDKIGFHGVELDEKVYKLISDLRNLNKDIIISVDIGVNFETAPKLVSAGVSKLVSGSTIYSSSDIGDAIRKLSLS
jgi:ribulose-phosphate 3-epimerase